MKPGKRKCGLQGSTIRRETEPAMDVGKTRNHRTWKADQESFKTAGKTSIRRGASLTPAKEDTPTTAAKDYKTLSGDSRKSKYTGAPLAETSLTRRDAEPAIRDHACVP